MSRLPVALATTLLAGAAAVTPLAAPAGAASATPAVTNGCVASVPEPGTTTAVEICYSLFRPAGATSARRVPMIMHSHGWGMSRTTDPAAFEKWLDAGFGVLSFDQRGFGESGGKAHLENPSYEGQDVQALVQLVSRLSWVRQDGAGDPRLGAIGGSYGGGYQFVGAFTNLIERGKPVFDALAPEITWWDLKESLGPEEVARTEWIAALTAASLPSDALPPEVVLAAGEGVATGMWPEGQIGADMDEFMRRNGPAWHSSQGRRLDIPVLFGQGATDNLFPLDQGLKNWRGALTRSARSRSIFVGYNGGHTLPSVLPPGTNGAGVPSASAPLSGDPCSQRLGGGSFSDLAFRFMTEKLKGRDTGLRGFGRYHLATADGRCQTVDSVTADRSVPVGTVATTEAGGAYLSYEVADGPLTVAGTPWLSGDMTALGVNNKAFYALAVGTTPADARIVQNNMLPVNEPDPVLGEPRRIELPSVAVDVPEGQKLFVMASPVSDMFGGMSSRTPGAIILENATVHLPVVS